MLFSVHGVARANACLDALAASAPLERLDDVYVVLSGAATDDIADGGADLHDPATDGTFEPLVEAGVKATEDAIADRAADVVLVLYEKLSAPPFLLLDLNDIFVVFAAFLAVLIAIEIFVNITLYLRDDVIHVKLVIATALMAIARKVIVLDLTTLAPMYLFAIGVIVLALGVTYWLVSARPGE